MHVVNGKRVQELNAIQISSGKVVYWMSRDQRVQDNWALLYAQQKAVELSRELSVVFTLCPSFLDATLRHYDFMLEGLELVERELNSLNISFEVLVGEPVGEILQLESRDDVGLVVTDFSPLRISRTWKERVSRDIKCAFHEVDAHNIVPCWEASSKQEYAARTIRPKLHRVLDEYLCEFPQVEIHTQNASGLKQVDWRSIKKSLQVDQDVQTVDLDSGFVVAQNVWRQFLSGLIVEYAKSSNDPNKQAQSDLSPYLHFGHISSQRIVIDMRQEGLDSDSYEAFLEQVFVRKELADNFCFYNKNYDAFAAFPEWAKKTLNDHIGDPRDYIYTLEQFENAQTHDELWNAAQVEMVNSGKMHGYMRMYWAKKILEWTETPAIALEIAIYLNDKYELDGRDPNGYVGIAWSIGGVHDQGWKERNVFGKVRYMNRRGCERKFDVKKYIGDQDAKIKLH